MIRRLRRAIRRLPRPLRRLVRRWLPARGAGSSAGEGGPVPSPGAAAFLDGDSFRQVAYLVGSADPGIIDPREDWPGAVRDAQGVVRDYAHDLERHITRLREQIARLQTKIKELSQ